MFDDDAGDDIHPLFHGAPKSTEFKKLRKRIVQDTREAVDRYGMVERVGQGAAPPKWLVCLSGGKDSYTLLAALIELQWRGLLPVELLACNLDQGQPGFPATVLPEFLTRMGVPHRIEYQDTYSIVIDKVPAGRTYCALCSRLRRGNLYRIAREEGCTRSGAGPSPRRHPRDLLPEPVPRRPAGDDAAETGERGGRPVRAIARWPMSPRRIASDSPAPWTIRSSPAISAAARRGCSGCRSRRCSTAGKRPRPGRRQKMFRALMNARPSHLLDPALFDFAGLVRPGPTATPQRIDENATQLPGLALTVWWP